MTDAGKYVTDAAISAAYEAATDSEQIAENVLRAGAWFIIAAAEPDIRAKAIQPFTDLFSGGPDTACRTTHHDGIAYVEVPLYDVQEAFRKTEDPS